MELIELPQLWTVAAVLAGFQVSAFIWRINRELAMEKRRERTWLTWAEHFLTVSFLLLVIGVYLVPLLSSISPNTVAKLLGTAIVVSAMYPFVLAGHYNLYCSWGKKGSRPHVTKQERAVVRISFPLIAVGVSLIWLWA